MNRQGVADTMGPMPSSLRCLATPIRSPYAIRPGLSNRSLLFAFTNLRCWMLLKGSRQLENRLLMTTVSEGLSPEPWLPVQSPPDLSEGVLLLVVRGEVILQELVTAHSDASSRTMD